MGWPKGKPRGPRKDTNTTSRSEVIEEVRQTKTFSKGSRWTMKAGANWETASNEEEGVDRLHIPKDLIPEGMDLQWVTSEVYGQSMPQHRMRFERKGWTPVHPEDFDGRFSGMFTATNHQGEINMDGLVLMARPIEMSKKAKAKERRAALEQVAIKEAALTGGNLEGVTGAAHSSAKQFNHINRSIERIEVPQE